MRKFTNLPKMRNAQTNSLLHKLNAPNVNEEAKVSLPNINQRYGSGSRNIYKLPAKVDLKKSILANNSKMLRKSGNPGSRNDLDPRLKRSINSPSPGYATREILKASFEKEMSELGIT